MEQGCELFFPLPEQKDASKDEIKVILGIFKRNLNNLPFGNHEQSAKEIIDILYKSNKIRFTNKERLTLLKDIEPIVVPILAGLQKLVKDVVVPIGRNEEKISRLLVATHYEFALAYRCLLGDTSENGISSRADATVSADCIRMALYHLGEILRTKYIVFTNPGGTIWRYIYTLYICAHNYAMHSISLPASAWCRFNSVEEVFKSILLLSMSSPLTMRGSEFNAIYDSVPELIKYIDLGKIKCGEDYSNLMTFNLSGTEPPKKQFARACESCGNSSNCLAVNTSRLISYIEEQKGQMHGSNMSTPMHKLLTSPGQLDNLQKNLSGLIREGAAERIKGKGAVVELVAGFSDAYTYLSKEIQDTVDITQESGSLDNPDGWEIEGEESIVVEEPKDWTATAIIRAGLRKSSCKIINQSRGGYCLYLDAMERLGLRVGELVIIKESVQNDWRMAVIAWVSGKKIRTDIGLKLLEGAVSTGTLRQTGSNGADVQLDCMFLTPDNGSEDTVRIITAFSKYHKGDRLLANYRGEEHDVTVSRINSQTSGYVEYVCDWRLHAEDLVEVAAPEPVKKDETGMDFESVWELL